MTANNLPRLAQGMLGAVLFTLLVACVPAGYAPTDQIIWAGYSALVASKPAGQLPPLEQAQQVYTIQRIGEGNEITAPSFASIKGCAPASVKSKDGKYIGRGQLIDLVPKQGSHANRITLYYTRWYDTNEWWAEQVTATSAIDGSVCVQVPGTGT